MPTPLRRPLTPRRTYRRPPIVEAAIELAFEGEWTPAAHGRLQDLLQLTYTKSPVQSVRDEPDGSQSTVIMMSSENGREVVGLGVKKMLLTIHALAPYPGWEAMLARAATVMSQYVVAFQPRALVRVGVRYIDRIVIPALNSISLNNYLRCLPLRPDGMAPVLSGFHVVLQSHDKEGLVTQLSVGSDDPEQGKIIVLYDLNVARSARVPVTHWHQIANDVHERQREIFENSITENTRELFQ